MSLSKLCFAVGSAVVVVSLSIYFSAAAQATSLTLNQIGGSLFSVNYSTLPTSTAFGKDEIGGGGLAIHKIPNVRDGIYGNSNSWIGDSLNSFVGISFGAVPVNVGQVAWGRDNLGTFGDRTAGLYTLEYTTVPNPNATTTSWTPIGSVNYPFQNTPGTPLSMSARHAWSFTPVLATGIRLTVPGSSFADGADIDELETEPFAPPPLTLQGTGGAMPAGNIALAGTAFAKDLIGGGAFAAHTIPHLNDGIYGNPNSWIGDTESSFAGINLGGSKLINRVAFGRDNTGAFGDRSTGNYLLQYTTAANPNAATPDGSWTTIGPTFIDVADADHALRHAYQFTPVLATGVRLFTPGNGIGSGMAIDELEVFAVPEPSSMALLALGGALLGWRIRRRSANRI